MPWFIDILGPLSRFGKSPQTPPDRDTASISSDGAELDAIAAPTLEITGSSPRITEITAVDRDKSTSSAVVFNNRPDMKGKPMQKTSLEGKIQIALHEGISIERYLDTVGVWTIGIGVTKWAGADINPAEYRGRITVRHAIDMMEDVLPRYEAIVRQLVGPVTLPQHIFDALVSAAYNIGPDLATGRNTRRLVKEGKFSEALMLWKKPRSIIKRRRKEAFLARTGHYSSGKIAVWAGGVEGAPHKVIYKITTDDLREMMKPILNFV